MKDVATVEDIVVRILELWGKNNPGWNIDGNNSHPHEANFLKLDITKATTQLKWLPRLSLDETLQWVVDWYKAWGEGQSMREFTLMQIEQYEN